MLINVNVIVFISPRIYKGGVNLFYKFTYIFLNSEIYCIEGENLAYKNFHDGDFVHIMRNHSFKKGDIVLTNDFELFEVKTRHKNNTVSLYKNNNKKRVDIKEIIGTVVGYYKYK